MRKQVYSAILRQDLSFHDYPSNSVGRLTARLATDAALVRRSTGERLGLVVQSATGLLLALGISFAASWQLTLVIIGLVPILGAVGGLLTWALNNSSTLVKEALEGVTATTYEAAENIRTVASLGMEEHIMGSVERSLEAPRSAAVRIAVTNGVAQGLLQFIIFSSYGLVFLVGAEFIKLGLLEQEALFRCFFVLAFSALSSANAAEFAGDQGKAESAKRGAFALFARRSKIDPQSDGGLVPDTFEGKIEFRNVWFAYPARPEVYALKDLSFTILPGQQVGVCGESGSGKSTIIQLLLRFFDPQQGSVLLDGRDLREYNVRWLRSKMGLVQQQPELWSDNIMYNILYGNVATAEDAPSGGDTAATAGIAAAAAEEGKATRPGMIGNKPIAELGLGILADGTDQPEAVSAATMALAHRFIMRKPDQYASPAGAAGTPALSGGQAQRVAIARALIREDASIFLADEATAALDSVSERKVQKALEHVVETSLEAGRKRTSIVIAHRLSTIKDSSKILVLDKGALVEEGTHHKLIATKTSLYRDMAVKQDGASAIE
jgi:ATP-binding cassette subfamily B (MDR/TAP) protein 1